MEGANHRYLIFCIHAEGEAVFQNLGSLVGFLWLLMQGPGPPSLKVLTLLLTELFSRGMDRIP